MLQFKSIFIAFLFFLTSALALADMSEQTIGPATLVKRTFKLDMAKMNASLSKGDNSTIWGSKVIEDTSSEIVLQRLDVGSIEGDSGNVHVSFCILPNGYYVIVDPRSGDLTEAQAKAALQDAFQKLNLANKTLSIKVLKVSTLK